MPLGDELSGDVSTFTSELVKNVNLLSMSNNINDLCRVCLVPTASKKASNLFFASGRSIQLWAKVMACAWVQVFEGDGLPSQICYKCHNKLDIAYQFKQQCEAADAHIRQYLSKNNCNKVPINPTDTIQNQPGCLSESKPLNFNVSHEILDLDLSLSTYHFENQDVSTTPQHEFRLRESDFAALKQEPGFIHNLNVASSMSLSKNYQINSNFKCEGFNASDIILDSLPAKLFESVDETIDEHEETAKQTDNKFAVWNLQQKNDPSVLNKNDFLIVPNEKNSENRVHIDHVDNDHVDMAFFNDDRVVSPLNNKNMLSDICSDSSTMDIDNECSYRNTDGAHLSVITQEVLPAKEEVNNEIPVQEVITKSTQEKENNVDNNQENTSGKDKKKRKEVQEQCELCGKVFKYKSYMRKHLHTHTGTKPFTCSYCKKKFTVYHSLVKHIRSHTGDKPFICAVCGKSFSHSTGLKLHMKIHTGEKPYECDICSKRFSQKSNLFIHKKIHSSERNYICEVCNKGFKFFKHLESHSRLHFDEKEFECILCQKNFRRKSQLHAHLVIHTGERPFKCLVCNHAFSNSSNLRAHSRIHLGIKPYKCKICDKGFAHSSALNRHMQHSCNK